MNLNLVDMWKRAAAYLPLTPWERALRKFVFAALIVAIVNATPQVVTLSLGGQFSWIPWLITTLVSAAAIGAAKYFTAKGDPLLATVAQSEAQQIAAQAPQAPNGPVNAEVAIVAPVLNTWAQNEAANLTTSAVALTTAPPASVHSTVSSADIVGPPPVVPSIDTTQPQLRVVPRDPAPPPPPPDAIA